MGKTDSDARPTTRRGFIAGAAMAAGMIAGASLIPGCSKGKQYDVPNEYLPIGSIVKIKGEVEDNLHMIVARRPMTDFVKDRVTGEYSVYDANGNVEPYDYACVNYPFGLLSNPHTILGDADIWAQSYGLSDRDYKKNDLVYMGDILMYNRDSIEKVLFIGYDDNELERRAAQELNNAKGTQKTANEALADLENELARKIEEARGAKGGE